MKTDITIYVPVGRNIVRIEDGTVIPESIRVSIPGRCFVIERGKKQ